MFRKPTPVRAVLIGLFLLIVSANALVSDDRAANNYPEKGKVVAANLTEHTDYVPMTPPDSKGRTSGGQAFVHRSWTYRIETDDRIYEFAGGKKQSMSVGDSVDFRVVKDKAHVRGDGKETKYHIASVSAKQPK